MIPLLLRLMNLHTSFPFPEQYTLHIFQMPAHGLPGTGTIPVFNRDENFTMALQGFYFSLLCLKVFFTGLAEEIEKSEKKPLQNPVS